MSTAKPETLEMVRANVGRTPFHQWLKPQVVAADAAVGSVTIHLPLRPEFHRNPDRPEVHGGILAALIDITGHAAVVAKLLHGVSTIDLRVDYLRVASGKELRGTGMVVKLGRTIGIVDVRIDDDQGKAVAIGRAAYLIKHP